MIRTRNLFFTKTAIATYISFLGLCTALSPNVESLLTRGKTPAEQANLRDWVAIFVGTFGALGTLAARYDAGGVHTPKYLLGRDEIPTVPPLQ